jgi:hypothetical protein
MGRAASGLKPPGLPGHRGPLLANLRVQPLCAEPAGLVLGQHWGNNFLVLQCSAMSGNV